MQNLKTTKQQHCIFLYMSWKDLPHILVEKIVTHIYEYVYVYRMYMGVSTCTAVQVWYEFTNLSSICSIWSKLIKHKRVEEAHVSSHLLHSTYLSFFFSVCEFYDKTRRGTLKWVNFQKIDYIYKTFLIK